MSLLSKTKKRLSTVPLLRHAFHTLKMVASIAKTGSLPFIRLYPPGHFYSPIPAYDEAMRAGVGADGAAVTSCPGIDLREEAQIELLERFARYYPELPFSPAPSDQARYHYDNEFFTYGDAIALYSVLRHFAPRKVVEVGSGFSSALMLDVNERFLGGNTHFTFIEPYPDRLQNLLRSSDANKVSILKEKVQTTPPHIFQQLERNDILFIDSSHVSKSGSDVNHLVFNVLPLLKPGVIVHFHDIFWPFNYPAEWIMQGNAWNETFLVRAFLQYNSDFEIILFNSFISTRFRHKIEQSLPLMLKNGGASLWLRRK